MGGLKGARYNHLLFDRMTPGVRGTEYLAALAALNEGEVRTLLRKLKLKP